MPSEIPLEVNQRLARDKVFQQRFGADPLLNKLYNSRADDEKDIEVEFATALGGVCSIPLAKKPSRWQSLFRRQPSSLVFLPPSPAVISLLGRFESPYLTGGDVRPLDIDIALRILILRRDAQDGFATPKTDIELASANLCGSMGLDYTTAHNALSRILRVAFLAYEMMPDKMKSKKACSFDVDWLASIVASVSNVVTLPPDVIMWDTSMVMCGYYVMQGLRRLGVKGIEHRSPNEKIFARVKELQLGRIKEYEAEGKLKGAQNG